MAVEREKIIKHFQYSREGFAMFTDDGQEILSNILYIQFANLISDTPIHAAEEVLDLEEFAPIQNFLEEHKGSAHKRVLRETITIDKGGKIFLVECMMFLNNSYEISINDISRQEEESRKDIWKQSSTTRICRQTNRNSLSNAVIRKVPD